MERQQKARKNNISRVARLKKQRRKRRISLLICGVLVIGVGFFIGYKLYIKNKCKYQIRYYIKIDISIFFIIEIMKIYLILHKKECLMN